MQSNFYYPPPESDGDWRWLDTADDVTSQAGMNTGKLDNLFELQNLLFGIYPSAIVIIRNGYLVREQYSFMGLRTSRFDIWSCTKSFTGIAWGMLLEDSRQGLLPNGLQVDLDSPAYSFIPEGHPLSDPRKEAITIHHLLTMTSGIAGEATGLYGVTAGTGYGDFEHALGQSPNRYGKSTAQLIANPGKHWDYSDPAIAHLSLIFKHIAGQEMHAYMQTRIFDKIGIHNASWDVMGGSGFIGRHTTAHVGLHISARELARFGYLLLNQGKWGDEQLIPKSWVDLATTSSQDLNPQYGYTFWVNATGQRWQGLPNDLFAMEGYNTNRCYIIPSLDLVVVRIGAGPTRWNEPDFIGAVVDSIED